MSGERYIITDAKGFTSTGEYTVVPSKQLTLGYEAVPVADLSQWIEQGSDSKASDDLRILDADDSAATQPTMRQRLAQRGVPVDALTARLAQLDTSTRGSAEQRHLMDAEVMEDLEEARGAANRLELGD